MKKRILDMCCGSRMFYFDKHDPNVLFTDIREYHHQEPNNMDGIHEMVAIGVAPT